MKMMMCRAIFRSSMASSFPAARWLDGKHMPRSPKGAIGRRFTRRRGSRPRWQQDCAAQSEHVVHVRPAPSCPLSAAGSHRIDERRTRTRLQEHVAGRRRRAGSLVMVMGLCWYDRGLPSTLRIFDATPTPLSLSLKLSLRRGQSSSFSARLVIPEIAFAPMNTRIFCNYRCFRFRLERTENRSVDSSILSPRRTIQRNHLGSAIRICRSRLAVISAPRRERASTFKT